MEDKGNLVRNKKILEGLFELNCLELSIQKPFTYASGLKGPIYCDNRKLLSSTTMRDYIASSFEKLWRENQWGDAWIAAMATAGIAHGAFLAQKLNLPMVYVRSSPKKHGKGELIEGDYQKANEVVVLEDLVNQASSIEQGINALRDAKLSVKAVLAIVDYQMPLAQERLSNLNIELYSLVTFEEILHFSLESQRITRAECDKILEWKAAPDKWS